MQQRRLGPHVLAVSVVGLDTMGLAPSLYGPPDDDVSVRAVHHARDLGFTLIDTAVYGGGHSEEIVGRAVWARRDGVVLTPGSAWATVLKGLWTRRAARSTCSPGWKRPRNARAPTGWDGPDRNVPVEDPVGALGDLVRAGLVRVLGLSQVNEVTAAPRARHPPHPRRAMRVLGVDAKRSRSRTVPG